MNFRSERIWVSIQDDANSVVPDFAIFLVVATADAVAVVTVLAAGKTLAIELQALGIFAITMLLQRGIRSAAAGTPRIGVQIPVPADSEGQSLYKIPAASLVTPMPSKTCEIDNIRS